MHTYYNLRQAAGSEALSHVVKRNYLFVISVITYLWKLIHIKEVLIFC